MKKIILFLSLFYLFTFASYAEDVPEYNSENPLAKGVVLMLKNKLEGKEEQKLLEVIREANLEKTGEYNLSFSALAFSWASWQAESEALDVCEKIEALSLSVVESCAPDSLIETNDGGGSDGGVGSMGGGGQVPNQDSTYRKLINWVRALLGMPPLGPKDPLPGEPGTSKTAPEKIKPKPIIIKTDNDLRSCGIIEASKNLKEGKLSDLWAQEMIGSDLMRKEVEKANVVANSKKHLIATFDLPARKHSQFVRNLMSDKGSHAVLPEMGNKVNIFDISYTSRMLAASSKLLNRCGKIPKFKGVLDRFTGALNSVTSSPALSKWNQCKKEKLPSYINASFGVPNSRTAIFYQYSFQNLAPPSIVVMSAGNKAPKAIQKWKTNLVKKGNTILVGSLQPNGRRSTFSQTGSDVSIMAPSDRYITTNSDSGEYKKFGGTSGSTPLVTGTLGGFELLSGYHPTGAEVKHLLKKTAIRSVGGSMLNSYKLAMVGKKLKAKCGLEESCIKKAINSDDTYQFSEDEGLTTALKQAFPQCAKGSCKAVAGSGSTCVDKKAVFERVRKQAFLNPQNPDLWRAMSCIYKDSGFEENAKSAINNYKVMVKMQTKSFYAHIPSRCYKDSDCVLVPNCGSSTSALFRPMNKWAAEVHYNENCASDVTCNGKCRCNQTEKMETPNYLGKYKVKDTYKARCVSNLCAITLSRSSTTITPNNIVPFDNEPNMLPDIEQESDEVKGSGTVD